MTNIELIKNKLSEIHKYLNLLEKYKKYPEKEIAQDDTLRGAIERYLYLACQTTIDLAEMLIVYHRLRSPTNYGEIFEILAEKELISKETMLKMKRMTGFRNILTHGYGEINFSIVYQVLTHDIEDIRIFTHTVEKII